MKTITPSLATILLCFGLLLRVQAVLPPPDGGYPNFTTAEGQNALKNLTTGAGNTAVGWFSLFSATTGSFNTGLGAGTLLANAGDQNTAAGVAALLSNTTGAYNTASGVLALRSNISGNFNSAFGQGALASNTTGLNNTALGAGALFNNGAGEANTAAGFQALNFDVNGSGNTAIGYQAGEHINGGGNIALGAFAGINLTTGDANIDIGNPGIIGESSTIRIGTDALQIATYIAGISGATLGSGNTVFIDNNGHLGTIVSSRRFKEDIKPMNNASEGLFRLQPVTFRYTKKIDPAGVSQLGLVAEDVEKVNPDLVVHDKEGKPYSVRYDQVNAMLLNEFLKAHRKVEEQEKRIDTLTAQLKEQAAQIQRVSERVEVSKPGSKVVSNP